MPEDIVRAASLIRTGKVFALGMPLDRNGPQTGLFGGRWNPIHTMLATGTDAVGGPLRQGPRHPLFRRRHQHAGAGGDALGCARPHLLRRQDVQRLRRPRGRLQRARQARHRAYQEQDGRAAACCSTSRASAASTGSRTARAFPTTSSIPAPRKRTSRSGAAISSSCAPGRWSAAWPRGTGAAMPAVTRPA